jgi:TPP-dependent pyruvate/acetoin dehydrogenase alpha subunit
MHMSMGQEFVPVGVCAALEGKADVFASYRSHVAVYLVEAKAKGEPKGSGPSFVGGRCRCIPLTASK